MKKGSIMVGVLFAGFLIALMYTLMYLQPREDLEGKSVIEEREHLLDQAEEARNLIENRGQDIELLY